MVLSMQGERKETLAEPGVAMDGRKLIFSLALASWVSKPSSSSPRASIADPLGGASRACLSLQNDKSTSFSFASFTEDFSSKECIRSTCDPKSVVPIPEGYLVFLFISSGREVR